MIKPELSLIGAFHAGFRERMLVPGLTDARRN
jgi:hypothetical protein